MEYVENSAYLPAAIASKKLKNIDSEPRSLMQSNKSSVLQNVSEDVEDIYNVMLNVNDDDELQPEDATESKLDEKMIHLLELLDASIEILEDGTTDFLTLLNYEDDESGYDYVVCDHQKRPPHEHVGDTGNRNDDAVVQENHRNEFGSECQAETNNSIITSVTKKQNQKSYELNEFTESIAVVLMLFSLYFLLSNIV